MLSLYSFFNENSARSGRSVDFIIGPTREAIIKAVVEVAMFKQVPVVSLLVFNTGTILAYQVLPKGLKSLTIFFKIWFRYRTPRLPR